MMTGSRLSRLIAFWPATWIASAAAATAPTLLAAQRNTASVQPSSSTAQRGVSSQPASSEQLNVPERQVWLGTVHLPARVKADGQNLAAGTYRVRLTGEYAKNTAVGQSEQLERWVEFVQGTQVKGRAMAPVVPSASAASVSESAPPHQGSVRVERLKDDDYYRLWFNYRGDQVLIYLPIA